MIDPNADTPLTREARAIVDRAGQIASQRGASEATSTDLLRATLQVNPRLTPNPDAIAAQIAPEGDGAASVSLRHLLINAGREAESMGHHQVGPPHLLAAMLYSDSPATSEPLQKAGLTLYDVRQGLQTGIRAGAPAYSRPLPSMRGVFSVSPVFLGIVGTAAVSGSLLWIGSAPRLVVPLTLVFVVAGWIISLCIHEFGHAFVAYLGGDHSVVGEGYLTLNPLRYTNATMSIVLPVVFLLLGGIALPGGAVYVNHSALRSKGWSSAVSLAGPGGTFVCWLAIAAGFGVAGQTGSINSQNVDFFGALAALGFFMSFALLLNLLPVPGLDGFGVIRPWLPYSIQLTALRYGTLAILGVYAVLWVVAPVRSAFFHLILQLTTLASIPLELIVIGLANVRIV